MERMFVVLSMMMRADLGEDEGPEGEDKERRQVSNFSIKMSHPAANVYRCNRHVGVVDDYIANIECKY